VSVRKQRSESVGSSIRLHSKGTGTEHGFPAPGVRLELPDTASARASTENVRKVYCTFEE
jgi:hypothetical protein